MPVSSTIALLIATKNRCDDLLFTLSKIQYLWNDHVTCVVFDDGSSDGTFEKVQAQFPQIKMYRNEVAKGYLYCRNKMLNECTADYAVSLDDDAHFLTENPLEISIDYFEQHPQCGLLATRIFWSKAPCEYLNTNELPQQVKSFVGCGHIWRMEAWRDIPNYPEWFEFYGEENFASFQLFAKGWEVHYVPRILVQHRVDLQDRARNKSTFAFRYRRAIRADWYNYFLFLPFLKIPKMLAYSLWMQCRGKIFKGHVEVVSPVLLALLDLLLAVPKIIRHRKALSPAAYQAYTKLNETKIYWKPEK